MQSTADGLKRAVPEWSARATTEDTSRTDAARLHDAEPMEFILSSNWALKTEGVKSFYEILYKREENFEIQYDRDIYGFRIKCFSYSEVKIVTLVRDTLDQLIQKETEAGLKTSAILANLEDWRLNKRPEKVEVPEKYTFPRDVALCDVRDTWKVKDAWFKKGVTTNIMLPENALSKVQRVTGVVLVASSDGRTVYVGAPEAEKMTIAKRKLDTLARFFSLIPRDMTQVVEVFLHNEGDRCAKGEYRYVADGNDKLLTSYILDRFDWPHPNQRYPTIFHKGVLIRLNPNNEPWKEAVTLSDNLLPIVKEEDAKQEFGAFTQANWRYPAKDAVFRSSDASNTKPRPKQTPRQQTTRPGIEKWVSNLPVLDLKKPSSSCQSVLPVPEASNKTACDEHNRADTHAPTKPNQSSTAGEGLCSKESSVNLLQSRKPTITSGSKPSATEDRASPGLLIEDLEPVPDLGVKCDVKLPDSDALEVDEVVGEVVGHPTELRDLLGDDLTTATATGQPQSNKPCPFEALWKQHRLTLKHEEDQSVRSGSQASSHIEASKPRLAHNDEGSSRSFHTTMNQKAGSRTVRNNIFPEFDPNMMLSINKSLEILMAPLRMWSGTVDLRIDLGRFYFLNVKKSRIQEPEEDDDEKHYLLNRIQTDLKKRHTASERFYFTRVITGLGGDANHIARMSDDSGDRMWKRPANGRSSTFEFICRKMLEGAELNFIVEIDTTNFSHKVKQFKPEENYFMVHCTKRIWDFRLVLSASQDLDDTCQLFADDLANSLRVMPGRDRLPELEVSFNKSHNVEILVVRTRNKACCIKEVWPTNTWPTQISPQKDVQQLYISEVWEMGLLNCSEIEGRIQFNFTRCKDNEGTDFPLVWYEVSLKSDTFSNAFEQNKKLEFGDEVTWTTEELLKSGAVEELVRKAAKMVENMDGVGFWNDNHQNELLRRVAPVGKPMKGQYPQKFW
ncbi:hypothetical protein F5Y07DRAFT_367599 [Xylaria sp. FL0933]|nr:hypothetical protein F5Y07DRAFT_367599 [Xylaria sp. FL0933]